MALSPVTFGEWKREVDAIFTKTFHGMDSDCFPDWNWYPAFTSEMTPQEAFEQWADEL
jgi:hypothetical protein